MRYCYTASRRESGVSRRESYHCDDFHFDSMRITTKVRIEMAVWKSTTIHKSKQTNGASMESNGELRKT